MRTLITALLALSLASLFAQPAYAAPDTDTPSVRTHETGVVTVSSRGADVRTVLHDLFQQSNRNYILEMDLRRDLFLHLTDVDFEEAFAAICHLAGLDYRIQNGIYFLNAAARKEPPKVTEEAQSPPPAQADAATPPATTATTATTATNARPSGRLPQSVLAKIVTTRLQMTDLREVFDHLGRQAGVTIECDISVPLYKIDAFLIKTSLKYALDTICNATGLEYTFTNEMSIRIAAKGAENPALPPVRVHRPD